MSDCQSGETTSSFVRNGVQEVHKDTGCNNSLGGQSSSTANLGYKVGTSEQVQINVRRNTIISPGTPTDYAK